MRLRRRTLRVSAAVLAGATALLVAAANVAGCRAMSRPDGMPGDAATRVITGAEPISTDRGRDRACLLLHGWLCSPADFGDLPQALDAAGWDVYAPLHRGHGTAPADLRGVTAEDLLATAREHFKQLRARYRRVAVVGFSMGGTIATILSAEPAADGPDRLVLVAPFYGVRHRWYYVLPAHWWAKLLVPFVRSLPRPKGLVQVNRPEGRAAIITYAAFPASAVQALFELQRQAVKDADVSNLRVPTLLVYSTGDTVACPAAMQECCDRLTAAPKEKAVFAQSNHHLLRDYDRDEAVRKVVQFLAAD